jgi:hypothetical protein
MIGKYIIIDCGKYKIAFKILDQNKYYLITNESFTHGIVDLCPSIKERKIVR